MISLLNDQETKGACYYLCLDSSRNIVRDNAKIEMDAGVKAEIGTVLAGVLNKMKIKLAKTEEIIMHKKRRGGNVMNMNFEEDVKIDENALDVEWLEQPSLVIKYARFSADARKIADLAKERLDIRTAELDRDIRAFPENYGLQKITESVVANTIILQPAWKDANEAYIDARFEQTMSQEIFRAITDRKDSLENLVRLHGAQYFAGPTVPRDLTAERQGRYNNKQANGAVGAALSKRKKG